MAVIFAYSNRTRQLRVTGDLSGWAPRVQTLSFYVSIPTCHDMDEAYEKGLSEPVIGFDRYFSSDLAGFKRSIKNNTHEGDIVILDWDSAKPKYFRRAAKSLVSIKYDALPDFIQERLRWMSSHSFTHMAYGEAIPVGSCCVLSRDPFSAQRDIPNFLVRDAGQQLWAIERGEYLIEAVIDICEDNRLALWNELSDVPAELIETPCVLGVKAYSIASTGDVIPGNLDEDSYQVLSFCSTDKTYEWDVYRNCDQVVLDTVVRFRNPDLYCLDYNDVVLYGDFVDVEFDGNLKPVSLLTYDQAPPEGFTVEAFGAISAVGQRANGYARYYRLRNRVVMENCREYRDGYRFLNRDDHVQEGDWLVRPNGTIGKPDCIGKKLSENSSTLIRPIGVDGWGVIVRDQITDDMEVEWQVRDRGKVWIDWTPWNRERDGNKLSEYERQYYTVYFRKKVHGFRVRRTGDPNYPLPFGMQWVIEGETLNANDCELAGEEFKPILSSSVGRVCNEPYIYARAVMNQFHAPLPPPAAVSQTPLHVEYVGPFPGGNPGIVTEEWQMFVSQYGLSIVPIRSNQPNGQETAIGTFWPHIFKINGQNQIIYCTDKVSGQQLQGLVTRGLASALGIVQRHMPFFNVIPATLQVQGRREVRTIEL